jgi:acyl-coenzyme A thioesterase PaaI-like protein
MTEVITPGFVNGLGITLWTEGDLALARADVQPEFFKPGTERVRLGVLATLVDMVAGSPAHAIINPTVDLRVTLLAPAPTSGAIELVTYPVKSGRLLFIGETLLHTGDETRPFARSVCTFMNKPLDSERTGIFPVGQLGAPHYDASLQLREPEPGVFEMDNHDIVRNGANGTVQGGAQALLAELVGERALERDAELRGDGRGDHEAVDLEIRYLHRVKEGPVRARGEVLAGGFDGRWVRVATTEPGADGRIVSLTTLQYRARS